MYCYMLGIHRIWNISEMILWFNYVMGNLDRRRHLCSMACGAFTTKVCVAFYHIVSKKYVVFLDVSCSATELWSIHIFCVSLSFSASSSFSGLMNCADRKGRRPLQLSTQNSLAQNYEWLQLSPLAEWGTAEWECHKMKATLQFSIW